MLESANALVTQLEQELGRAKAVQSELAAREAQGKAHEAALAEKAAAEKADAEGGGRGGAQDEAVGEAEELGVGLVLAPPAGRGQPSRS